MDAILLLETDFRREVVVEKNDRPTRLLALPEWSKAIG